MGRVAESGCHSCFPMVGTLPPCEGGASPAYFPDQGSLEDLRANREVLNRQVLAALKGLPFSEDIAPQVDLDAELGAMSQPRMLETEDLKNVNFTRRIPVRELRSKGWRTRVVDHASESGINMCTRPQDRVKRDTLDTLANVALEFYDQDCDIRLWKRDVSQAFRRVPVAADHLEFMWCVWMHAGILWVAQHLGAPCGTVAAVYAWRRVGHLLGLVLRLFCAPTPRYVDDFFGASRIGVRLTGGVVLSVLASLLGFPCDDSKSADQAVAMTVLGSLCRLCFADRVLYSSVDPDKAARYRKHLLQILDTQVLAPGDASKIAGRLSFAVVVSGHRAEHTSNLFLHSPIRQCPKTKLRRISCKRLSGSFNIWRNR